MINTNVKKQYPVIRMPNGHPVSSTMYNRGDLHGVIYNNDVEFDDVLLSNITATSTVFANLNVSTNISFNTSSLSSSLANVTVSKLINSTITTTSNITADVNLAYNLSSSLLATGTTTADLTVNAPSAGLLLDLYPNAGAAYSLRKLRSAYTGSAIRVRRSSDNTEQDIGFDVNGNLDTTALTTFCDAGDGFVTTWYDQSGNARNATQTTQANQPRIVSSGVVVLTNTKPSLSFNGTSNRFDLPILSFSMNSISVISVIKSNALLNNGMAFANPDNNRLYLGYIVSSITYFGYSDSSTKFNLGASTTNQELHELYCGLTSNAYKNTNASTQITSSTANENSTNLSIGSYKRGAIISNFYNGNIQEIIFYTTNQATNRTGIETNINTNYAIY